MYMAWRFPLGFPPLSWKPPEKNMFIDEAPYEAFNLMHILKLQIDGHIKLNKEFRQIYQ